MRISGSIRPSFTSMNGAQDGTAANSIGTTAGDGIVSAYDMTNCRCPSSVDNRPVSHDPSEANIERTVRLMMRLFKMLMKSLRSVIAGNKGVGTSTANSASPQKAADGPGGFLWKPVSDGNGKLVVLLPQALTGRVDGVIVQDSNGRVLEKGDYANVANGGREHFRFDKPGAAYGENIIVEVQLKDGSTKRFQVPNGANRVD